MLLSLSPLPPWCGVCPIHRPDINGARGSNREQRPGYPWRSHRPEDKQARLLANASSKSDKRLSSSQVLYCGNFSPQTWPWWMEGLTEGREGEKRRDGERRGDSKLRVLARKSPEVQSLEVLYHFPSTPPCIYSLIPYWKMKLLPFDFFPGNFMYNSSR